MKQWPMAVVLMALAQSGAAQAEEVDAGLPLAGSFSAAGVQYVEGGIGLEEHVRLRAMERDYNLKLEFADRDGAYRADVSLQVDNGSGGDHLLELQDSGPVVLLKLPPGKYRVTAAADGRAQRQSVTIGANRHSARVFYW